jgi:hypothetical protein
MDDRLAKVERYMEDLTKRVDEHAKLITIIGERSRYTDERVSEIKADIRKLNEDLTEEIEGLRDIARKVGWLMAATIIGGVLNFVMNGGLQNVGQ